MNTATVSILVGVLGLVGPVVAYLNGRFSGQTARAARIESITRTLDSLKPISVDHIVLTEIRYHLILDEHYKHFGPRLYKYVLLLWVASGIIGGIIILNWTFGFSDFNLGALVPVEIAILAVLSVVSRIQNKKHEQYEAELMVTVNREAEHLLSSLPPAQPKQ